MAVVNDRETPYAREQRRRELARQPYLTLEARQACIRRFEEGDRTLSRTANCGLLAFGIPAAYGGYNIPERWGTCMYGLAWIESEIYTQIASHHCVCLMIDILGTPAHYDFFLPQLAAGKRIGVVHHRIGRWLPCLRRRAHHRDALRRHARLLQRHTGERRATFSSTGQYTDR